MSNVIKRGEYTGAVVKVGGSRPGNETRTSGGSAGDPVVALDYRSRIDAAVDRWRDRVSHYRLVDDARAEGYERGLAEGRDEERADRERYIDEHFSSRIQLVETLLAEAKKHKEHSFRGLEESVVDLAVRIAEKLISKSIEADPSLVHATVSEAMSAIIASERLVLKVSAEDYTALNARYDTWFGMAGNVREFRIEIDKRLVQGDCIVETESGIVDAVMENRLAIITEELLRINR